MYLTVEGLIGIVRNDSGASEVYLLPLNFCQRGGLRMQKVERAGRIRERKALCVCTGIRSQRFLPTIPFNYPFDFFFGNSVF